MQNRPNTFPSSQRTSSRWYIAIFVLLVLAALTGLVQFHTLLVYQTYQQGHCTIVSGTVERHSAGKHSNYYTPLLTYTVQTPNGQQGVARGYEAPQQHYSSTQAHQVLSSYPVGKTYACWYNPADPNHAVLVLRGYTITDFLGAYLSTAFGTFIVLVLILGLFYAGVYQPTCLMLRGILTQGKVVKHILKRRKKNTTTYSRILFHPQGDPSRVQDFEASGCYPIGSWQPICYDPFHPENARRGGRPIGVGPAVCTLLCLGALLGGLLYLWLSRPHY